jgi:hypothetical protein
MELRENGEDGARTLLGRRGRRDSMPLWPSAARRGRKATYLWWAFVWRRGVLPSTEMIYTLGKMKYNGLWHLVVPVLWHNYILYVFSFHFHPYIYQIIYR